MSDPAIEVLVAHGYKYNPEAGSWSKEGEKPAPVQDSTCNETLRVQGKAYPRTCKKCGLGPCVGKPNSVTTPPAQTADHGDELTIAYMSGVYDGKKMTNREWAGLTDAEVMQTMSGDWTSQFYFARAIEAKLKEKNA